MSERAQHRRDDEAVADVLADLRALRLRLSSDLSAASGALETGEPAVASDILAGDSADLEQFVLHARDRLTAGDLEGLQRSAAAEVAVPRPRTGRRRWLSALPAVAVLAASATAAAVVAPTLGRQANHSSRRPAAATDTATDTAAGTAAPASFRALRSAIITNASPREVLAAAHRWHEQVVALIATSAHDPRRLATVIDLLRQETQLLREHPIPDAGIVLAAAARLEQHLLRTAAPLLSALPTRIGSSLPVPVTNSPAADHRHHATPSPSWARPTAKPTTPAASPSQRSSSPAAKHSASSPSAQPTWLPSWDPSMLSRPLVGHPATSDGTAPHHHRRH